MKTYVLLNPSYYCGAGFVGASDVGVFHAENLDDARDLAAVAWGYDDPEDNEYIVPLAAFDGKVTPTKI